MQCCNRVVCTTAATTWRARLRSCRPAGRVLPRSTRSTTHDVASHAGHSSYGRSTRCTRCTRCTRRTRRLLGGDEQSRLARDGGARRCGAQLVEQRRQARPRDEAASRAAGGKQERKQAESRHRHLVPRRTGAPGEDERRLRVLGLVADLHRRAVGGNHGRGHERWLARRILPAQHRRVRLLRHQLVVQGRRRRGDQQHRQLHRASTAARSPTTPARSTRFFPPAR